MHMRVHLLEGPESLVTVLSFLKQKSSDLPKVSDPGTLPYPSLIKTLC